MRYWKGHDSSISEVNNLLLDFTYLSFEQSFTRFYLPLVLRVSHRMWDITMLGSKEFNMRKREKQLSNFWRVVLLLVKILSPWWFLRQKKKSMQKGFHVPNTQSRGRHPDWDYLALVLFVFWVAFSFLLFFCFLLENVLVFVPLLFLLVSIFIYISRVLQLVHLLLPFA
jgi:hypothetical protein